MANLHCECQELKPKGETNSSFLVLHPSSGVHTVKTVGSHLKTEKLNILTMQCFVHFWQLAQHGMNVVLMSRSSQKLEKVAETIG